MGDEVTCPICQRPLDPLDGKCGSDEAECYRIGYEREKARADAATAKAEQYERDWYAAKSDFGTAMAKSREALAAARRECDAAHRLAFAIAIEKRKEWEDAGERDHASGASTVAVGLRAAFIAERKRLGLEPYLLPVPDLAAPADGDSK